MSWQIDDDGRLVWPLRRAPDAIYLDAAVFAVDHDATEAEARQAFEALRDAVRTSSTGGHQ